jgi:hypothetical protein
MPTDAFTITLSDLVRKAAAIVDPDGNDEAVSEFVARYEDVDEPVRGILDGLDERIRFGADEIETVQIAQAITLYLAHRLDSVDDDPQDIIRLAAREEFDGQPPENVQRWLDEAGIEL